jgi:23S rRNA (uridine2552-2'-O)-methyltransferase
LPKAWVQDRKKDYYYKKAKEEKYRSRASYKLIQAMKKYDFIKYGDVVIDLGTAPGGWIQVAKRIIGNKGFIL